MNDEPLLRQLRHDLDEFVGEPGPAPALGTIAVAPVPSGRSPWLVVGSAAATVAVVVGGLLLLTQEDAEAPVAVETPAPSTVVGPVVPSAPMPVPPTPAGWTVVEWGDVRLSLPPDLEPYGPGCTSETRDEYTVVISCDNREVTIISGTAGGALDPDRPGVVRNGLVTDLVPVPDLDGAAQLLVDETSSLVRFVGFAPQAVEAIADTVGVSSTWRVRLEPAPPVPDGWQTVELDGYSFRVPPNWGVSRIGATEIDGDVCGFGGVMESNVLIGRGSLNAATVNCVGGRVLVRAVDGVRVVPQDDGPDQFNNPFVSIVVGSVQPPQVVRIGLAGDGTVGRTIFGSVIEAVERPAVPVVPVMTTAPPDASAATPSTDSEYASIGTVIEDADGVRLCFVVLDSLPPQCGAGVRLGGFDWDEVDGEQTGGGADGSSATTWLGDVFVRGTWDESALTLTVIDAGVAADSDRDLLVQMQAATGEATQPDYSLPCAPPAGGWDRPTTDPIVSWPAEDVAALPGYAGSWNDPATWVFTVKFTGAVAAADASVRALYDGPVCVVEAQYDAAELGAIATELRSMSSMQVLESAIYVDANGEWVGATTVLPTTELQASLDERYGEGTVRLRSSLTPVPTP